MYLYSHISIPHVAILFLTLALTDAWLLKWSSELPANQRRNIGLPAGDNPLTTPQPSFRRRFIHLLFSSPTPTLCLFPYHETVKRGVRIFLGLLLCLVLRCGSGLVVN